MENTLGAPYTIDPDPLDSPRCHVPGHTVRLIHSITLDWEHPSNIHRLQAALELSPEELAHRLELSVAEERVLVQKMEALLNRWDALAVQTRALQEAKRCMGIPPPTHTDNAWVQASDGSEYISNAVYRMTLFCKRGRTKRTTYYASWRLELITPLYGHARSYPLMLAGRTRKPFDTEAEAWAYLNEKRADYADFFTELYPPIPKDHINLFLYRGALPVCYRFTGKSRRFREDPDE